MCELDGCCVDVDGITSSVMASLDIRPSASCRTKREEGVRKAFEEADKFN